MSIYLVKGLNDCNILKNRLKYIDFGLEIVCPNLKYNFGIFLGMVRIKYGHEEKGYDLINKIFEKKVMFKHIK